ncbi:hypothetical protein COS77_02460 [Candidatus Roizmanbacteria bacterium CG06_land_8_20_14_3_00_34_14]|uniref:Antitoxin n=2 Tax=Candidatus Roizmaniibacteriota TaxID=1752723 RepID=A0A2M7AUK9_9BACT|nr:MAG: hypothetical protein COT02_00625 [Candidatus Roizmanbacteria bacterium CG07_land_8_20_14_0_80_34_15]PIU74279.1 MAG: hypothetical protein COS77_02460 [Candidatus Roizmanbacteria bacterium CG06_land_8_20_14_3_00_34_14]
MNNISYIPQFVSVSDLQRNYPALLKTLKTSQKPLLILKKNDLEAIILTPDLYQSIMEKIQVYDEKEALLAISNYKKEKVEKKLKKMKSISELFE